MIMRSHFTYLILAAAAASFFFLPSCAKEEKELTIADQEAAIESYIDQNFSDYNIIRRNGSNRIVVDTTVTGADIDSLEYGDSLYFYYAGYVFTNGPSALFSTNNEYLAAESGYTVTDPDFSVRRILFSEGSMIPGLENGLYGVKEGEHCVILFSAKHGYYDDYVYNIPKLSALAFEVWIEDIIKN